MYGVVRTENQDSFYLPDEDDKIKLYMIADGMGGHRGGKEASDLAINSVEKYIKENFNAENIMSIIKEAIIYADKEIQKKAKSNAELDGMGTTIDVALIYNNRVYIGHVGDSRIYRVRKHIIRLLTKDHSYVEELIDDGKITRDESYNHPEKNIITRALGFMQDIEPDVCVKGFLKEDVLVLCTDGLTNMISIEEIKKEVTEHLEIASDTLIKKANKNGGFDNITLVIVKN